MECPIHIVTNFPSIGRVGIDIVRVVLLTYSLLVLFGLFQDHTIVGSKIACLVGDVITLDQLILVRFT
jgi:hypothetical protein